MLNVGWDLFGLKHTLQSHPGHRSSYFGHHSGFLHVLNTRPTLYKQMNGLATKFVEEQV